MSYQVRLPEFEGPFELLFHLIEREEVDIWDIPIARITEQYLEYIASIQELDLELAGEFLVMAATLLALKARLLLPSPSGPDGETGEADPRLELVERLLEYRRFKETAQALRELAAGRDRLYPRGNMALPPEMTPRFTNPVGQCTVADLLKAMYDVLTAYSPPPPVVAVPRRIITVEGRLEELSAIFALRPFCSFYSLLPSQPTRQDVVVTFLALLELVRQGMLRTAQEHPFGTIDVMTDKGEEDD